MRLPKNRQPQKNKESSQKGLALSGSRSVAAIATMPAMPAWGVEPQQPPHEFELEYRVSPRSQFLLGQKLKGQGLSSSAQLKGRQIHGRSRKIFRALRVVPATGRPVALAHYLEHGMAKTFNGIFDGIITFESLYHAYLRARKGKRKSWPCRHFERDLEANLIQLQNELIWGEYRCGGYRSFYVTEPKRRKITALRLFRDRVVQHAIFAAIEPIWEARFVSGSYACRIGKGTHAGADKAQEMLRQCLREHGEVFVLKADIRKYFASIDHEILLNLLRRRIVDKRIMAVIEEIIHSYSEPETPGKGIPIGNLTSQLFANIYLDALDQWMKCRRQERWYVRYMDDWIVVHPDKRHLQALRIDAEAWLADNLELQTNHKTFVFLFGTTVGAAWISLATTFGRMPAGYERPACGDCLAS